MSLMKKLGTFSFSSTVIRTFGALFLLAGLTGNLLQTSVLGSGGMSNMQLFEAMMSDEAVTDQVTMAVVLQALETCAVPLYAFLLVEGATHTSSFSKYFIRVLGLAVVCQLPYNLVMTGSLLYMRGLNPVFALVMAMAMLYFFLRYPGKEAKHLAMKALAIICTFLWSNMLGVSHGAACVILTAVLWALRGKPNLQTFVGMAVAFSCSIFSLFYMVAPVSFLILYFYEGERESESRLINYGVYPAMLIIFGILTTVV